MTDTGQGGGKGLFVKELDRALMDGRSDLSVHSLKDMPMEVPKELLWWLFPRERPRDVVVLKGVRSWIFPVHRLFQPAADPSAEGAFSGSGISVRPGETC